MATIKNIKIKKNKILTYAVNKAGFKTVYGSVLVNQNQTININMKNLDDVSEPFQLGDRLFGISSFVDYFTPSGTYDVDSLKYLKISQTTGTSLTNLTIVKSTWLSQVETTLGIETPRGTSNDFIFTYDGANWNLTGATEQSAVDLEDYGISFSGTATNGDVITVTETQYNKFAFFVLDSNYRKEQIWWSRTNNYSHQNTPSFYTTTNAINAGVSATYINNYVFETQNLNDLESFNTVKNLGVFLLSNNLKITALMPTIKELTVIFDNRIALDNIDPTILTSGQSCNLTDWKFININNSGTNQHVALSCMEVSNNTCLFATKNNDSLSINSYQKGYYSSSGLRYGGGFIPIFEVPVM